VSLVRKLRAASPEMERSDFRGILACSVDNFFICWVLSSPDAAKAFRAEAMAAISEALDEVMGTEPPREI
jgi:hypothetical protein